MSFQNVSEQLYSVIPRKVAHITFLILIILSLSYNPQDVNANYLTMPTKHTNNIENFFSCQLFLDDGEGKYYEHGHIGIVTSSPFLPHIDQFGILLSHQLFPVQMPNEELLHPLYLSSQYHLNGMTYGLIDSIEQKYYPIGNFDLGIHELNTSQSGVDLRGGRPYKDRLNTFKTNIDPLLLRRICTEVNEINLQKDIYSVDEVAEDGSIVISLQDLDGVTPVKRGDSGKIIIFRKNSHQKYICGISGGSEAFWINNDELRFNRAYLSCILKRDSSGNNLLTSLLERNLTQ